MKRVAAKGIITTDAAAISDRNVRSRSSMMSPLAHRVSAPGLSIGR